MTPVLDLIKDDQSLRDGFESLPARDKAALVWQLNWLQRAHKHQIEPAGDWWSIWLMLAGRGAGKTRAAAETLGGWAWQNPGTRWLVSAPTSGDVKGTCFEGDSGLLNVLPKEIIADYNKALHEITLTNGSFIKGIPASEPQRFRGPQFHGGWLDELAAWEYLKDSWDMIQFGIRLGTRTKLICSTTPKPLDVVMNLVSREGKDVVITRASTYANIKNLAPSFQKQILQYENTNLGRQEIHAEIIDPSEGGILKASKFRLWPAAKGLPQFEYVLQSYDCAFTEKTTGDPTACTVWAVFTYENRRNVMLIDAWDEHLSYPDLRARAIRDWSTEYGGMSKDSPFSRALKPHRVLVEAKASGQSLLQDLHLAKVPAIGYNPGNADKVSRAHQTSPTLELGLIWVPESKKNPGHAVSWALPFLKQVEKFPLAEHDDYVDTLTQAIIYLRNEGWFDLPRARDRDEPRPKKERVNPYAA